MQNVTATLKEMYYLNIGHDGWTNGCGYDAEDEWAFEFFGDSPHEICKQMAEQNLNTGSWNFFHYYKVLALIHEGDIFIKTRINKLSRKDGGLLEMAECDTLWHIWNNDPAITAIRKKRFEEQQQKEKEKGESEQKVMDLAEYARIKAKYNL